MAKLTLDDISDLRAYERERPAFQASVIALKRARRVPLGPILTAVFENRETVRYQIQEMARAERMLSDEQIQTELDVYNPLVPGPGQLCLTLFVELTTEEELRGWLPKLVGVERSVALDVGGDVVRAVPEAAHAGALTREEVTASVHYLWVSLTATQVEAFAAAPEAALVADHPAYRARSVLGEETRASLLGDLEGTSGRSPR